MPKCQNCGVDINDHELKCRLVDEINYRTENKPVFSYLCPTQLSAFDLVAKISDSGGDVCMVMNGDNPTRCVLSTYDCSTKMEDFCYCGIITQWAEEWDVEYFNERMK